MKRHLLFSTIMLTTALQSHSQLLPKEPLSSILPPAIDHVRRTTEQLQQQALRQQQLTTQLAQKAALPDPLTTLPETLDVLSQTGQLRWREVEVEQGFRAIEREWLLLVSVKQWQQLVSRWPQLPALVQSEDKLDTLGLLLVNIKVPAALDSAGALNEKLHAELKVLAGRNHIYQPQVALTTEPSAFAVDVGAMCKLPVTLGMVDTAIALDHPALRQQPGQLTIAQHNFLPADIAQSYGHGTAIAGVLAGQHNNSPLLPNLSLYSAGAFYPSTQYQQSATLSHIVMALNWLASQQVTVINMSLTGPDNPVLAAVVRQLADKQVVLIAAAGNGGPAAAPLFPAAYDEVVAVTAVDQHLQLYRWANHGAYIEFAAPGVKVLALKADGDVAIQSGTSIAAPVVSAAIACLRAQQPAITLEHIRQILRRQAYDLGGQGRDVQFGYGLITAPLEAEL
jgi:minor extracellular protease Epr